MTPTAIKAWRKRLKLTQAEAAERLGIGPRTLWAYEHEQLPVPLTVALACAALEAGLEPAA